MCVCQNESVKILGLYVRRMCQRRGHHLDSFGDLRKQSKLSPCHPQQQIKMFSQLASAVTQWEEDYVFVWSCSSAAACNKCSLSFLGWAGELNTLDSSEPRASVLKSRTADVAKSLLHMSKALDSISSNHTHLWKKNEVGASEMAQQVKTPSLTI